MLKFRISCMNHKQKYVFGGNFNTRKSADDFMYKMLTKGYNSVDIYPIKYDAKNRCYNYRGYLFCELSSDYQYGLIKNGIVCTTYTGSLFQFLGNIDLDILAKQKNFIGNISDYTIHTYCRIYNYIPFDFDQIKIEAT